MHIINDVTDIKTLACFNHLFTHAYFFTQFFNRYYDANNKKILLQPNKLCSSSYNITKNKQNIQPNNNLIYRKNKIRK